MVVWKQVNKVTESQILMLNLGLHMQNKRTSNAIMLFAMILVDVLIKIVIDNLFMGKKFLIMTLLPKDFVSLSSLIIQLHSLAYSYQNFLK